MLSLKLISLFVVKKDIIIKIEYDDKVSCK